VQLVEIRTFLVYFCVRIRANDEILNNHFLPYLEQEVILMLRRGRFGQIFGGCGRVDVWVCAGDAALAALLLFVLLERGAAFLRVQYTKCF